jgi:hypothetical protein
MNNGPRKGGAPETFKRLKALPSLQGLYAIHKNAATGLEVNATPENTANLDTPEGGQTFRVGVDTKATQFTVTNTRTGKVLTFPVE